MNTNLKMSDNSERNVLRIALLQLLPGKSIEEQLQIGLKACRDAKEKGADIALFPEMWSTGYRIPQDTAMLQHAAIRPDNEFILTFGNLAKELNMAIVITYLGGVEPLPGNSAIVFDRHGREILSYTKVHTCDFGEEKVLARGNHFPVADLDTAHGTVRIGCMICYDREFPESARILMLKGAEILLVPNACPMEINRLSQLRARAYENMTGIATCNYPEGQPDCNGHSSAFDGIAYLPEPPGSRDTCLLEAGSESGIYIADFNLDMLRSYRCTEVHGNAYRRPDMYHLLTGERRLPPFLREDSRSQREPVVRLRPYKRSDAKQIVKWTRNEYEFRQWTADRYDHYPITAEDINAHYDEFSAGDGFYPMTAFDENGVMGHLILRFTDEEKRSLRFGFIIVDPARRGQGAGKAMIRTALHFAFDILKAENVSLGVFENNPAAGYCYRAVGFQEISQEKQEYYHVLGEDWKCITMEYRG